MWYIVSLNGDQECISSKQEKAMELNPPCAHGCSKLQTSCWCETGAELKVFPHRAGVPLAGCRAAEQSAFSGLARKTIKQQQTHSLKRPLLPVKEREWWGVQSRGLSVEGTDRWHDRWWMQIQNLIFVIRLDWILDPDWSVQGYCGRSVKSVKFFRCSYGTKTFMMKGVWSVNALYQSEVYLSSTGKSLGFFCVRFWKW